LFVAAFADARHEAGVGAHTRAAVVLRHLIGAGFAVVPARECRQARALGSELIDAIDAVLVDVATARRCVELAADVFAATAGGTAASANSAAAGGDASSAATSGRPTTAARERLATTAPGPTRFAGAGPTVATERTAHAGATGANASAAAASTAIGLSAAISGSVRSCDRVRAGDRTRTSAAI
jgi:hypothetical protein